MSNIVSSVTECRLHDGFEVQWVTDVVLDRPAIQWKSREYGWKKTRHFWVSSVVLEARVLGGPFIETMAFPSMKGGMGFGLYQNRAYLKDMKQRLSRRFSTDPMEDVVEPLSLLQVLEEARRQHHQAIRVVSKGCHREWGL